MAVIINVYKFPLENYHLQLIPFNYYSIERDANKILIFTHNLYMTIIFIRTGPVWRFFHIF